MESYGQIDDTFIWMKFHKDLSGSQVVRLQIPAILRCLAVSKRAQGTKDLGLWREAQREVRTSDHEPWSCCLDEPWKKMSKYIRNPKTAFTCSFLQLGTGCFFAQRALLHNFCADDLAQHALSLAESCFAESRIAKSCISESYLPVSFMAGPAVCMRVLCITQVHPESQTLHRASERLIKNQYGV